VHELNEPPSSEHWKLEPDSEALKLKLGVELLVAPEGPLSIVVSGATVSTVKERVGGDASVLPAGSLALTEKVWAPSASAVDV
jgi:hypothetical protein